MSTIYSNVCSFRGLMIAGSPLPYTEHSHEDDCFALSRWCCSLLYGCSLLHGCSLLYRGFLYGCCGCSVLSTGDDRALYKGGIQEKEEEGEEEFFYSSTPCLSLDVFYACCDMCMLWYACMCVSSVHIIVHIMH